VSAVDLAQAPVMTVVRGRPSPDELAAVVPVLLPVLLAAGSAAEPADAAAPAVAARPAVWADRARAWRVLPRPGPHAWRASALPR
jgi:hypothetical protein